MRTSPGRLAAKRMGKPGGRPQELTPENIAFARKLYDDPDNSVDKDMQNSEDLKTDLLCLPL